MEVYEITGFQTGKDESGVNFLEIQDAFQVLENGYIYRQVLQSRKGIGYFADRLAGGTRIMGIWEYTLPDSTKELLAADLNFLYKYNTATGVFDQIPFGGSMAAYAGFNISLNDLYISGTPYPTKDNVGRFVFTGEGITANAAGSSIFFYNGTNVLDYTAVADNADYSAPPQGALTKAHYVFWFGERLNFFVPTIASIEYQQGILYSGIRNSAGNGDKFNVAGSGLLQADTYENITGSSILGQVMSLQFDRSDWTLEKTRDAFNPYFIRKVPSVLGTDAKFSSVQWADVVKSLGKTGVLGTDGRRSLKVDSKIPNFTADEINQEEFNLCYGGFDRENNTFLWSYLSNAEDATTQDKVLVNNYEFDTWSVYDLRLSVFGQTDVGLSLTWDDIEYVAPDGNKSWTTWDTTEEIWDKIGIGAQVQKTLAGDDLGYIYDFNSDNDDYFTSITGITTGSTTTITVSDNNFLEDDQISIEEVVGLLNPDGESGINNFDPSTVNPEFLPYVILSSTGNDIEINLDSTLLTAYDSGGFVSKPIAFAAKTIPFNPYRPIGRRVYVSHVEFLIDNNQSSLRVDVFDDEEEAPFIDNVLLQPSVTSVKAREWVSLVVDQESNFLTFQMRQLSPARQVRITSIRIHCQVGGLTNG